MDELADFASAPKRLRSVLDAMTRVIYPTRDLPRTPFRRKPGSFVFCEFHRILSPEFGAVLAELATEADDHVVRLVSLPQPRELMLPNGLCYGALTFPTSVLPGAFGPAIADSPAPGLHPIEVVATRLAMFGSGKRWSIWADRSYDIAVVHSDLDDSLWHDRHDYFFDAEVALSDFVEFNLLPQFRTAQFRDEFLRSFA